MAKTKTSKDFINWLVGKLEFRLFNEELEDTKKVYFSNFPCYLVSYGTRENMTEVIYTFSDGVEFVENPEELTFVESAKRLIKLWENNLEWTGTYGKNGDVFISKTSDREFYIKDKNEYNQLVFCSKEHSSICREVNWEWIFENFKDNKGNFVK